MALKSFLSKLKTKTNLFPCSPLPQHITPILSTLKNVYWLVDIGQVTCTCRSIGPTMCRSQCYDLQITWPISTNHHTIFKVPDNLNCDHIWRWFQIWNHYWMIPLKISLKWGQNQNGFTMELHVHHPMSHSILDTEILAIISQTGSTLSCPPPPQLVITQGWLDPFSHTAIACDRTRPDETYHLLKFLTPIDLLTRSRLVSSVLGLGSMGNECYSKFKLSSKKSNVLRLYYQVVVFFSEVFLQYQILHCIFGCEPDMH